MLLFVVVGVLSKENTNKHLAEDASLGRKIVLFF
jgi:hypothetical protein